MTRRMRRGFLFTNRLVLLYVLLMRAAAEREFRDNLSAMLDRVSADREPLVITREGGKPAAVLMSLDDFSAFEETKHLLNSPRNAARLMQAIAELEGGGGAERKLSE